MWTIADAVELCRSIEAIAPTYGCHVAITGGVLYKDGARKDLDILFYRVRQADKVDVAGLFAALEAAGIARITVADDRWCIKASYQGKPIDCFFPDHQQGSYDEAPVASPSGPGVDALFADVDEAAW